jgi:phage recombination protein Bet
MSNTAVATATPPSNAIAARPAKASILAKMAERFSVEPNKLLETLKATAFKAQGGVSNEQMISLLVVADQYGLNPFTRELFAFPDKGGIVPVVSVDGWARIMNSHPQFDGIEFAFVGDGVELGCTATIRRKDRAHPVAVTEYMAECRRSTGPWQSHPRRMLRHKAMIQCARLAFGFAGIYDEDEAERVRHMGDAEEVRPASSLAAVRSHVQSTGKAPATVIDMDVADVSRPSPLPYYLEKLAESTSPETAQLLLDEARDTLNDQDLQELCCAYSARYPTEGN